MSPLCKLSSDKFIFQLYNANVKTGLHVPWGQLISMLTSADVAATQYIVFHRTSIISSHSVDNLG